MAQPITIGRIVQVRLPEGRSAGEWRPAICVQAWSPTAANLLVFLDGSNDDGHGLQVLATGALAWVTSVQEQSAAPEGSAQVWRWPPILDVVPHIHGAPDVEAGGQAE